jgi:hypothetical protein
MPCTAVAREGARRRELEQAQQLGIYSPPRRASPPMSDKQKPAHTIRGRAGTGLKLTLWRHESDRGPWFTATPTRSYKTQDGHWAETNSYSPDDFLELAEMFREARAFVLKEQAQAKASGQTRDEEQTGYADQEVERKRAGGKQY